MKAKIVNCITRWRPLLLGLCALGEPAARADDFFAVQIEPLLKKNCYECHSHEGGKMKGGLTLDSRSGWAVGGENGPAVIPGKPDDSLLIQAVRHADPDLAMPPKTKLAPAEIALLEEWVHRGAPDPREKAAGKGGLDWWSLKPLAQVEAPTGAPHPIDAFIAEKLKAQQLSPSPEADRRTLIRRVTFDLHGLPPTPEEVEAFENDSEPLAYERLVDRLLASPRYGERWARHWLDVVHYGESNGFGMDRPRMESWPYRDYVIDALNEDKPYARFVEEQLAADALFPDRPDLIPALGFAAAGPFNQSALVEQVDDTDCKRMALNLDRDDMVASTANTFLSVTVQCARCHDHKFDPISQRDYYGLQAVFAGVGRVARPYGANPRLFQQRADLQKEIAEVTKDPRSCPPSDAEREELARELPVWERSLAAEASTWTPLEIERVTSASGSDFARQDDGSWLATSTPPDKDTYTIEAKSALPEVTALRLEVLTDERLPLHGPGRQENGNLHLSEIRVSLPAAAEGEKAKPLALQNPSADFNQADWGIERAIDGNPETAWGIYPRVGEPHQAVFELKEPRASPGGTRLIIELDQLHGQHHLIGRFRLSATAQKAPVRVAAAPAALLAIVARPPSERTETEWQQLFDAHRLVFLNRQLAQLPTEQKVWAIASDFPAFRNYKSIQAPYPIHILRRGDLKNPLEEVPPRALTAVSTLKPEFELAKPQDERARRAALAHWIVAPENMLTWRSIVNRVWAWHFGRGLVDTPNDFGRMGALPSHPELLDWLAVEFRDSGGSLKALHKLIVTSATYRQASAYREDAGATDSDNRLLARMNRQRLEAEEVRDALLAASGKIDLTMGGPSAMQFKFSDPNKEVSPGIDYAAFDLDSPASYRRSVYRFIFRNVNDPLLEAFDAVDPSLSTPKRNATVTPLQALALWNDRFVLRQCEHLAARVEREAPDDATRLDRAFRLLCSRPPTPEEAALLTDYASHHGLANACRVIINSNDFLFLN